MKFTLDAAEKEAMKETGIQITEYRAKWEKEYCLDIGIGINGNVPVLFSQDGTDTFVEIPDEVVNDIMANDTLSGFVEFIPYQGNKIEIKVF